ncbi:aldo/keto reductase [Streptacidiphilus pinicola]|uniref:Aldo/keto reductase n=1 Tax=Streptacidiphilus pinicola TaxID=2219663 RepID=A0A2X0IKD7_9ACTN|nr:aldo/keto reductase [Streptacidiphilus pinicola]
MADVIESGAVPSDVPDLAGVALADLCELVAPVGHPRLMAQVHRPRGGATMGGEPGRAE